MSGLTLAGIGKSFGSTRVLSEVSLDVGPREFLTLLGPSGCGKSTLLRVVAGLETPDAGSVSIGGRVVDEVAPRDRDCAMVFQSYALYPYMTVFDNIALPLRMRELSRLGRLPGARRLGWQRHQHADIERRVGEVAQALEIDALLARKPAQLSGGQRQRVALARAMVRHPRVFLMDEPLSNLDAKLRVQTRTEIAQLHRRLGVTFVYVTHDQAEAMTMSDRIAVMLDGRILQVASPAELYERPANLAVAEFIGSPKINVLPARLRNDGFVDAQGHTLPLATTAQPIANLRLAFRPENARLVPRRNGAVLGIAGHIVHRENLGSDVFVHLRVLDHTVVVRVDPEAALSLRSGDEIHVVPDPRRVSLFDGAGERVETAGAVGHHERLYVAND